MAQGYDLPALSPPQTFAGSGQPSYFAADVPAPNARPSFAGNMAQGYDAPVPFAPITPPQTFAGSAQPQYSPTMEWNCANAIMEPMYNYPPSQPSAFAGNMAQGYDPQSQITPAGGQIADYKPLDSFDINREARIIPGMPPPPADQIQMQTEGPSECMCSAVFGPRLMIRLHQHRRTIRWKQRAPTEIS
jgi:hypothetical protein